MGWIHDLGEVMECMLGQSSGGTKLWGAVVTLKGKAAIQIAPNRGTDTGSSLSEFIWPIIHEKGWRRSNFGNWSNWDVKRFYDYAEADGQLEVLKADKAQSQDELYISIF